MYKKKIYEPESKFSLQMINTPGVSTRSGTGKKTEENGANRYIHDDPLWISADISLEKEVQQRRKNGSGQLDSVSPNKVKERILDEDIPNLYRADPAIIDHHVNHYVQEYASWYNSSLQDIDELSWNDRKAKNKSLDKGATYFSARGDELRKYLVANKDRLTPEYYNEVTTFLHDQKSLSEDLLSLDKTKREAYSQFESQSAYDAFVIQWERQEKILKTAREDPNYETLRRGSPSTMRFGNGGEADDAYYLINGGMEYNPFMGVVHSESFPDYRSMNNEEIGIFNYYYNTGNYQTAMEYLELLKETLAWRAANEEFQKYEGRTGKEIFYGIGAGFDQLATEMSGAKDTVFGGKDDYPATKEEYLDAMIRNDLEDNGPKLPKWMGGASLGQVGYDVLAKTSNSLPSGLISVAANMVFPGSGSVLEKIMAFGSSGGDAYIDAKRLGFDDGQARGYAVLEGTSEVILGYLADKLSDIGKKHVQEVLEKVFPGIENILLSYARDHGTEAVLDEGKETLQRLLEPVLKRIVLYAEADMDWEPVAYDWFRDALSSVESRFPESVPRNDLGHDFSFADWMGKTESNAKFTFRNVEGEVPGLASRVQASGVSVGRAAIVAEQTYAEAEKRFGSNADMVLKLLQPGQNPRRFLDGFQNAYILGKQGAGLAALGSSKAAAYLSREQREFAYAMGALERH